MTRIDTLDSKDTAASRRNVPPGRDDASRFGAGRRAPQPRTAPGPDEPIVVWDEV